MANDINVYNAIKCGSDISVPTYLLAICTALCVMREKVWFYCPVCGKFNTFIYDVSSNNEDTTKCETCGKLIHWKLK